MSEFKPFVVLDRAETVPAASSRPQPPSQRSLPVPDIDPNEASTYVNLATATINGFIRRDISRKQASLLLQGARTGEYLRTRAVEFAKLNIEGERS